MGFKWIPLVLTLVPLGFLKLRLHFHMPLFWMLGPDILGLPLLSLQHIRDSRLLL